MAQTKEASVLTSQNCAFALTLILVKTGINDFWRARTSCPSAISHQGAAELSSIFNVYDPAGVVWIDCPGAAFVVF